MAAGGLNRKSTGGIAPNKLLLQPPFGDDLYEFDYPLMRLDLFSPINSELFTGPELADKAHPLAVILPGWILEHLLEDVGVIPRSLLAHRRRTSYAALHGKFKFEAKLPKRGHIGKLRQMFPRKGSNRLRPSRQ